MRNEKEVYEAITLAKEAADELDENNPGEAAAALLMLEGLLWVVEEGERNLIEELAEDVQEYKE